MDLEEKEQRYRFLYSKVDNELNKIKGLKDKMEEKKTDVYKLAGNKQVDFSLHFGDNSEDLYSGVNSYIGDLENLKHYLSLELEKIVKQIDLKNSLVKKYGKSITVSGDETPVVTFNDDEVSEIESKYTVSKKLIDDLKSKMKE
ncbi:MAG: hypothetical protein PHH82_02660 [Candidatus ainarchaeum sp.]|nr:hypothetical protein [Candidatus ainarchaeum sp.]